ncbi:putative zinc finger protein [Orchesella cincta]|uniref:Putative zinc finger protein n=1 Tax=Orchesella cincta TaxID=48709 RepID=A0A1D2MI13_ORCCI|nr:putative zinc finger protein [Orchesella cincta]
MEAISRATGKLEAAPTPQIGEAQQKRMFRCTKCSYQSVVKCHFNIHMRYMHGTEKRPKAIKKFKCPGCPKKFSVPSVMKKHFSAQHKGEMPYSCVFCEKRFSTSNRYGLDNHIKAHIREFHYSCRICDYSTTSRASLKSHIRYRHEGLTAEERKQKMKVCPVCKILVHHLRDHMRKHTGECPFRCGTCGKSLKSGASLRCHQLAVHEGQKPHCCEICKAKFGRLGDLKAHLRYVHGPEKKPFFKRRLNCVFCDKNMAYGNHFSHYRRHIHEYPFNCPNCDKSFVSAGDLKWHVD